ncbi:MAG: Mn-dependent DtxR family transcriptional regulator [Bradymonadia bacterium]|jgi:Mn-dependent DtxR family transcriptional regulator
MSIPKFTPKQGQYLAFIHMFTKLHRQPPSEAEIQDYFGTCPPTIHSMIVRLHEAGLIDRTPRTPRSIRLIFDPEYLPALK